MHIIEAAIELADATGERRFHNLGREVADLMQRHILRQGPGVLREFFKPDWTRSDSPEGRILEPGHQFEWVWILLRAQSVLGLALREEALQLYAFADRHGADPDTGLVYDQVDDVGAPLVKDSRSWPQTEALKANLAIMEWEGVDTRLKIARILENIFNRYLDFEPFGTWMDHRTYEGGVKADKIPSTTLYHLQLAFTELLRLQPIVESFERNDCGGLEQRSAGRTPNPG